MAGGFAGMVVWRPISRAGRPGPSQLAGVVDERVQDLRARSVAHHLSLLSLPPVLEVALTSGRCTSPRTLHELSKLHDEDPGRVADLVASDQPITCEVVAAARDAAPAPVDVGPAASSAPSRLDQLSQT